MAGGLSAIQTLAITIGLPFSVLMLVMCVSTLRTLSYSVARVEAVRRRAQLASIKTHLGLDTDDEVVDGPATASQWWASLSREGKHRIAQMASAGPDDVITVTPSYMLALLDEFERQGLDPRASSLKVGIFGAEPWTEDLRHEVGARVQQGFRMHRFLE